MSNVKTPAECHKNTEEAVNAYIERAAKTKPEIRNEKVLRFKQLSSIISNPEFAAYLKWLLSDNGEFKLPDLSKKEPEAPVEAKQEAKAEVKKEAKKANEKESE